MAGNGSRNKFFGVVKKVHRGELSKKDVTPSIWKASMRLNPVELGKIHPTVKEAYWRATLVEFIGGPST